MAYEIEKAGDTIPATLRQATAKIIYTTQTNKEDDYWRAKYANFSSSGATGGDGNIVVYSFTGLGIGSYAHESGHNLATKLWGDTNPPASSPYGAAQSQEIAVSNYGANSSSEDFAEACKMWCNPEDHEILKSRFPKKY